MTPPRGKLAESMGDQIDLGAENHRLALIL
jgi:hypothetical protein